MTFVMLGIGFTILLAPVVVYILTLPNNVELAWPVLFPVAIFSFFAYVLISSSLKMFTTYSITGKGIGLYIPPFHKRNFTIEQIKEVNRISPDETRKIIEASIIEQNSFSESGDLIGYIQMLRKRSPAFRYFTIAPTAKVTTSGPKETITSLDIKSKEGCILLTLKNEEKYFLTPDDPGHFEVAFHQMHPDSDKK